MKIKCKRIIFFFTFWIIYFILFFIFNGGNNKDINTLYENKNQKSI
jgi:hypothetical protein